MDEHRHNPTILFINATSDELTVGGDANWDDQELDFNGSDEASRYTAASGSAVAASTYGWAAEDGSRWMVGIICAGPGGDWVNHPNGFQMSVGWDGDGNLSVTEENTLGRPTIRYSAIAKTPWLLALKFEDA